MRVLVMTPTYSGMVWDEAADSIANNMVQAAMAGHHVEKGSVRGYGCGPARTRIADKAVKSCFDYVFMVDDDVVLPDGALVNMLEHEVAVCLGFYAHQGKFDGTTCLCKPGSNNYDLQMTAEELRELRESGKHLVQVKGGGMGCALIDTAVFDAIDYPYYRWVDYGDRHGTLSEDLYFCEQCNRANIPIHADTRIACGHFFRHRQEVL